MTEEPSKGRVEAQSRRGAPPAEGSGTATLASPWSGLADRRAEDVRLGTLRRIQAQQEAVSLASASEAFVAGEVEQLAREVTELAAKAVGVERANVWLFNPDETELHCIDLYEATPARHSAGAVLREAQYAREFSALKGAPFVDADDAVTDPRTAGYVEGYLKPLRITAMLDAVVRVAGRHIGRLCLEHVDKPHHWERDEVAFACQLADKIALSLVNRARQETQETLRASEVRYRRLFESARDGILILDAQTAMVVDVNPFLAELLGFTRDEILRRKVWDLGFFKDVVDSEARFAELVQKGYVRYEDLALRTKDGRRIEVEFVSNVYLVNQEKVIQCNIRDISERKRAQESHARLAMAVEQAAEVVMVTDAEASILYVNPAFERTTGYTREEALGRNPRLLKSGKQDAEFYRRMWTVLLRGDAWSGRIVNQRKDGAFFEVEATISPVRDAAGRTVNYVAVNRDITNEAHLERQLFQAQKMEAIGRLAAGVAHDFNNLLGVITGYGEIVHRRLAGEDPLKGKVEQILRAAERAGGLTRQLLAFGRKQVLQPKILDLNLVVPDMEKMLRRLIGEDIELVTRLAPDLGRVRADAGQIEQVLMNLAVNARDAMLDGGRITIETGNADVDASYAAGHAPVRPGPYVLLAFTDTGAGMDAATQARIFEPFFSTKEVGKGTGLGLSTVYGIVKQSEGYVWVYSEVGLGTTFKVYLPRVDEEALPEREEEAGPLLGGTETVLLVEDEASLRELLREALDANGYSVLVARDGAEAVQIAAAHPGPIPIMVTDIIMPGMTGPKIVDVIAVTRPTTKVLFISGYSDETVLQYGLRGPGRAFLSKPFGPEVLLRRVRETLDAHLVPGPFDPGLA
jgi:two-component system, cell cycle sensor histidine kinase and response regulator CckA